MYARCFVALSALVCTSATPPPLYPASVPGSPILQVMCDEGAGSAFRVGPQTILSVNHVTSLTGCRIDGHPINISYHSGDFSMLTQTEPAQHWLEIDCGGFVKGRKYQAEGYARGRDKIVTVDLEGTDQRMGSFSILEGTYTVIPGMSGGPVIDAKTGRVVGTTNIYNYPAGLSGSVALKDTPVCRS